MFFSTNNQTSNVTNQTSRHIQKEAQKYWKWIQRAKEKASETITLDSYDRKEKAIEAKREVIPKPRNPRELIIKKPQENRKNI